MFEEYITSLSTNQFFSGGIVLVIVGALLAYLKQVPGKIFNFIKNRFIFSAEINSRDQSHYWVQMWLNNFSPMKRKRKFVIMTHNNSSTSSPKKVRQGEADIEEELIQEITKIFIPAPGIYIFRYNKKFILMHYNKEKEKSDGNMLIGFYETITFSFFSFSPKKGRELIDRILNESYLLANKKDTDKVKVMRVNNDYWANISPITSMKPECLIMNNNIYDDIKNDLLQFFNRKDWYTNMGILWKRGYILHGEPGNGKTSLIRTLAGDLHFNICVINLSSSSLTDDKMSMLFNDVPARSFILMEDIDCVFKGRSTEKEKAGITFNGLLNLIDGMYSKEGQILFMTTNHIEKLDPALIRPGRADRDYMIGNSTNDQQERMFKKFFPDSNGHCKEFSLQLPENEISLAKLQEHFLKYSNKEAAVKYAKEIEV